MARTATMPMPQNTTHPAAVAPPIPEGQTAQALPDWLMQQQTILRTAPDGDTAIRLLYADLLAERALLIAENTRLQLALQAATAPTMTMARRTQRPPLRPRILGVMRLEAAPMTLAEIEQALPLGPLADSLRGMVKEGIITLVEGRFALPPERAPAAFTLPPDPTRATAPPTPKRGGRIVRPG